MATQEDRSLSSGMFFPKWMKSKINDKFDIEQSALSPTELDDSFMYYYRHPLKKNSDMKQITPNSTDSKIISASQVPPTQTTGFANIITNTSHYIQGTNSAAPSTESSPKMKIKSKGTDDGFKGETAKVGSTVVRVANQMVSGKLRPAITPHPVEECEELLGKFDPYRRRGSKSLPASPLHSPNTSPKAKRRINKYFTGPYVENENSKGWLLSNLLAKREISQSMGFIGEEKREELERAASTASMDEIGAKKLSAFKPKASELREMNFWSPTSM